jgi:hypothetical protein
MNHFDTYSTYVQKEERVGKTHREDGNPELIQVRRDFWHQMQKEVTVKKKRSQRGPVAS